MIYINSKILFIYINPFNFTAVSNKGSAVAQYVWDGIIISSEGFNFKTLAANSIALAPLVTA